MLIKINKIKQQIIWILKIIFYQKIYNNSIIISY